LEKDLENLIVKALMRDFYLFEYSDMKKIEIFLNLDEKNDFKNKNDDTKLIDLFMKMDCDKDGLISCEDLYEFISKRKIKICENELQNFIGLFDEDMDGFLDWNEFLFMILPSSSSFEYDLNALQKQEEEYNQYYYKNKAKNEMISNNYCFNYNNNNFEESNGYDYNNNINGKNNNYIKNDNIPNSKKDINGNQYYFEYQSEPMNFTKNTLDNNYFNKIETPIYNKKTNLFIDNNQFCELCKILYEIIDSEKNIEFLKNKLFSDNNFNLNKLFNYFDKYQNGYISLVDFQEGLESFDINNKNYLLLFSNFDLSNNGRFNLMN
jgi:Ca2+-binding EF-hand superfamily protein